MMKNIDTFFIISPFPDNFPLSTRGQYEKRPARLFAERTEYRLEMYYRHAHRNGLAFAVR